MEAQTRMVLLRYNRLVFVLLYSIGLLIVTILSIRVSLDIRKPKWYWPLVIIERPLLFAGLALIAFRVDQPYIRSTWVFVAWFLAAAFIVQSYYDVITFDAKEHKVDDENSTQGQEIFSLCMGTLLSVLIVFPAYAMNLAWAYRFM